MPAVVSSIREWKALNHEGIVVTLPSGLVARIKPISLSQLWKLGKIPNDLTPMIAELVSRDQIEPENAIANAVDTIKNLGTLLDVVCEGAFLEPKVKIGAEPDDPEFLSPDDITEEDRMEVMRIANAPSAALREFRRQQEIDAGTVPNS